MVQKFQDVSFGISTDAEVLAHYNITGNAISLFRLVDNERLDLESEYIESIDATKLSRFIEINSLHLVTEYNPVVNNNSLSLQPLKSLSQGGYLSSQQRPFSPGAL